MKPRVFAGVLILGATLSGCTAADPDAHQIELSIANIVDGDMEHFVWRATLAEWDGGAAVDEANGASRVAGDHQSATLDCGDIDTPHILIGFMEVRTKDAMFWDDNFESCGIHVEIFVEEGGSPYVVTSAS